MASFEQDNQDKPNIWLNLISFLLPIVGLILFLFKIKNKPKQAKSLGIWAILGVIAGVILELLTNQLGNSL